MRRDDVHDTFQKTAFPSFLPSRRAERACRHCHFFFPAASAQSNTAFLRFYGRAERLPTLHYDIYYSFLFFFIEALIEAFSSKIFSI
jgi:hypothetical protein